MPLGLPKEWIFNNFPETWEIGGYATAYFNSLLTAAVVIVVVLTVVGFGAYATSKLQFKLRGFFVAYFSLRTPSRVSCTRTGLFYDE